MILRGPNFGNSLMRAMPVGLCLLLASGLNAQSPQPTEHAPNGWSLAGNNPTNYRTGVDPADQRGGLPSAYLASLGSGKGFGTLMQSISAADYAGKRIRLRAWVKSEDVGDWAGMWLRVDKERGTLAFDNMQDRGIKGTQTWNRYDVVLDVPADATSIHFGVLLTGTGEVWMNDVSLEVVDMNTPTTRTNLLPRTLPQHPINLGFND